MKEGDKADTVTITDKKGDKSRHAMADACSNKKKAQLRRQKETEGR